MGRQEAWLVRAGSPGVRAERTRARWAKWPGPRVGRLWMPCQEIWILGSGKCEFLKDFEVRDDVIIHILEGASR